MKDRFFLVLIALKTRTLEEINEKIKEGTAKVWTVQEIIDATAGGEEPGFDNVDVVTTATKGLMSGIAGIFSFRLSPPKTYRKFVEISVNGIPGFPGPCPNEFLGIVDFILYGTAQSKTREKYSGGMLFRDLVAGKLVHVEATSSEGVKLSRDLTLADMQYARMIGTRQAIKNYNAMINPTDEPVDTIFSVLPFKPGNSEITFSGCGALNPFQNDPDFESFGVGMPVLVNGNKGYLMGPGTRNYVGKPNMMTLVDFKGMKPEFMGAFNTSYGQEPICSIAAAIPITDERKYANIVKSDRDVPLAILNLVGREKLAEITYGDVWDNNFLVKFFPERCKGCSSCIADEKCPTGAFNSKKGIDRAFCFNCGMCVATCPEKDEVFDCDLKSVIFQGKRVPVVLRQSDRHGAIKLARLLKKMILSGEFPIVKPTGRLEFADHVK